MIEKDESAARNLHEERSETTRARILDAAQIEFVTRGLEGTRMELVARRAGLNKSLIYRHFNTKEELFRRVLERNYQLIRQAEQDLELDRNPITALEQLCSFTLGYYVANPELLVLVGIENLHRGVHIAQSERSELRADWLVESMRGLVERGEREGLFRPGIDPSELWLLLSAQCWMTVANAHTADYTFRMTSLDPERLALRLQAIQTMIRRFVARTEVLARLKE